MKTVVELTALIEKLHENKDPLYSALVDALCPECADYFLDDPFCFVGEHIYDTDSLMQLLDEMAKLNLITAEQKNEYVAFQQEGAVEIQRLEAVVKTATQELSDAAEKYGRLADNGRFTYYPGGHPLMPSDIRKYQDTGDWLSSSDMC